MSKTVKEILREFKTTTELSDFIRNCEILIGIPKMEFLTWSEEALALSSSDREFSKSLLLAEQRWYEIEAQGEVIELYIYAQHCALAGKICRDDELIDSYHSSDDIINYEGTRDELAEQARSMLDFICAGAGEQAYLRKAAHSILAELGVK